MATEDNYEAMGENKTPGFSGTGKRFRMLGDLSKPPWEHPATLTGSSRDLPGTLLGIPGALLYLLPGPLLVK